MFCSLAYGANADAIVGSAQRESHAAAFAINALLAMFFMSPCTGVTLYLASSHTLIKIVPKAFIIGGSLVIVEGISKFDRWHMNYIEKKEMKEYRKNYPVQKQNYQLNYLEERR